MNSEDGVPRPRRVPRPSLVVAFWLPLFVLGALPARAGIGRWTSHGPEGGAVTALAVDPRSPGVLYAGGDFPGTFKSYSRAASWFASGPPAASVYQIAVDPVTPAVVHAVTSTGYMKSTDGGSSWRSIAVGLFPGERAGPMCVAAVPSEAASTIYLVTETDVWKSRDAGETWARTHIYSFAPPRAVLGIEAAPDGATVLAAMDPGEAVYTVYRSRDGGASWQPVGVPAMRATHVLAINPLHPEIVVVSVESPYGDVVFRSGDDGETWTQFATPTIPSSVFGFAFDPTNVSILLAGTQSGLFRTADGGATWTPFGGLNGFVIALRYDVRDPSRIYAATDPSGVERSTDGGATWTAANRGLPRVKVLPPEPLGGLIGFVEGSRPIPRIYAQLHGCRLSRSEDGGRAWSCVNQDVYPLAVDPSDSATVYGRDDSYRLLESTDGGAHFAAAGAAAPSSVLALLFDPADPSRMFASSGGVEWSADHGATWTYVNAPPDTLITLLLAVGSHPTTLYYANTVCTQFGSLYCTGTSNFYFALHEDGSVSTVAVPPAGTVAWAADPFHAGALLAGGSVVSRSADGQSWTPIEGGPTGVLSIAYDRGHAGRVYASGDGGVWTSSDGGAHWSPFNSGLESDTATALLVEEDGAGLHAALKGGGVSNLEPGSPTAILTVAPDVQLSVTLEARDPRSDRTATGVTGSSPGVSAFFVFPGVTGDAESPEVFVKAVDGRQVNGSVWFFYGGLTDQEYTLTVTEVTTGRARSYFKPAYSFCGGADDAAFPSAAAGHALMARGSGGLASAVAPCPPESLCLSPGRDFALQLFARDQRTGHTAAGVPVQGLDTWGFFSLPAFTGNQSNPEVFVKLLDATSVDGAYWLFYGGLTDLEYSLTAVDLATGASRLYHNPPSGVCGGFDTLRLPLP